LRKNGFVGTWKIDVNTLQCPKRPRVLLVQNGIYECKSCMPRIRVTLTVEIKRSTGSPMTQSASRSFDAHTIHLIQKKNGQVDSDEKFTVSADENTETDEFANWKIRMRRIAPAPPEWHVTSGTWQPFKIESTSDRKLLVRFRLEGDEFGMTRPTGESYRAVIDGTQAPYNGEPRFNRVSVKRIEANTIEETDKFNDKPLVISRMQ